MHTMLFEGYIACYMFYRFYLSYSYDTLTQA